MPAPPPESDEAMVNARGTISTPFAGTSRIRFGGSVLSLVVEAPREAEASSGHAVDNTSLFRNVRPGPASHVWGQTPVMSARDVRCDGTPVTEPIVKPDAST